MSKQIPTFPQTPEGWPESLPRFAESFRISVVDASGDPIIEGAWVDEALYPKRLESLRALALPCRMFFSASCVPSRYHDDPARWYGNCDFPAIYWHWQEGDWVPNGRVEDYLKRKGFSRELMQLPRGLDVPVELRARAQ